MPTQKATQHAEDETGLFFKKVKDMQTESEANRRVKSNM